ncbi:hypothetical protein LTR36_001622 [Oleoguttula mirabilis]|uniref:Uncharacterized protein n=1 Tax=Oleoguttula mirabilis TaxID=1507867 RepID=A0AAV9JPE3_9PEZI|nr:hypothetical protein LTR36_001622 [Oleoguttula mirabilis]
MWQITRNPTNMTRRVPTIGVAMPANAEHHQEVVSSTTDTHHDANTDQSVDAIRKVAPTQLHKPSVQIPTFDYFSSSSTLDKETKLRQKAAQKLKGRRAGEKAGRNVKEQKAKEGVGALRPTEWRFPFHANIAQQDTNSAQIVGAAYAEEDLMAVRRITYRFMVLILGLYVCAMICFAIAVRLGWWR